MTKYAHCQSCDLHVWYIPSFILLITFHFWCAVNVIHFRCTQLPCSYHFMHIFREKSAFCTFKIRIIFWNHFVLNEISTIIQHMSLIIDLQTLTITWMIFTFQVSDRQSSLVKLIIITSVKTKVKAQKATWWIPNLRFWPCLSHPT